MAREPIEILKAQLGDLMAEIALLLSKNEKQAEEIAAFKEKENQKGKA